MLRNCGGRDCQIPCNFNSKSSSPFSTSSLSVADRTYPAINCRACFNIRLLQPICLICHLFLSVYKVLPIKWLSTLFTLLAIYKKFVSHLAPLFFPPPHFLCLATIRIVVKLYFVVFAFLRLFLVFPHRLAPFLLVKVEPGTLAKHFVVLIYHICQTNRVTALQFAVHNPNEQSFTLSTKVWHRVGMGWKFK